jgi:autotransporter translocation and assembly factor TamB
MTGTLDVVRGTYQLVYPPLQARRFQVRSGTIEFPGIPGIDPNLEIEAVYKGRARSEPLDIIAQVHGTLQAPRVRLTSNEEPPISESDLASYLFFGVPTYEVGNIGTQTDTRSALASTLTPSILGYASSGLQSLAQSAGLLDYVSLTTTEQLPGTEYGPLANPFATAQLDLGRYVTPNVYVGVTQRLAGSHRDLAGRLEWRFNPTFTLELFAEDRFARNAPSFGYNQEALLKRVYGFFLFREWGY